MPGNVIRYSRKDRAGLDLHFNMLVQRSAEPVGHCGEVHRRCGPRGRSESDNGEGGVHNIQAYSEEAASDHDGYLLFSEVGKIERGAGAGYQLWGVTISV